MRRKASPKISFNILSFEWSHELETKSLGLVVMADDSCSNPGAVYWMDMTFFHIDLL